MESILHIYPVAEDAPNNRLPPMRKLIIYRPLICAVCFVALFATSLVVFGQPTAAQFDLAAEAPSGYENFTAILGLITQIAIALMFLVALVWFVWRGKSNEQLKEMVAGWKDTAERARIQIAELEAAKIKDAARIARLQEERKEDRKRILRLSGMVTGTDLEDLEISDD